MGCGRRAEETEVRGQVSYQGGTLTNATLTFFPEKGRSTSAAISNGEYHVHLAPRDYVVVITMGIDRPPGYREGDPLPPPKVVLPPELSLRTKSVLTASVQPNGQQTINFELK